MDDRLHILLIDDDEVDRMMARRALAASGVGAEFAEASNGRSALQLLTGQPFDCALLDLNLPDVEGPALLRQARAAGVRTPIIVLTGRGDEELAVELVKAGASDYLSKERLGRDLLTHAVRHAVRLHRAQVEVERAKRAAAELSEQHYRSLAESIPQIVFTAQPDGTPDYFNQRWFDYTGLDFAASTGANWERVIYPDDLPALWSTWQSAHATGRTWQCEYRVRRHDGAFHWHLGRSIPLRDADGQIVKWFGTCTDIDQQKHAQDALRFLAEASEVLASSLDYEATLASVARLAVPKIGDWCAVDMVEEGGAIRRLAVAHTDPSKVRLAEELQQRYPPPPDAPRGLPNVLRTGAAELYEEIPDELIGATAEDAEHARIVRSLGLRSAMIVPLSARGRTIGAITFVTAETDRRYGPADLAFAQDLARRAATAVDNARLYREAQDALRREARSAALLDTLFASSPTGLCFFDREGRYQRVNEALAAINGVPAADHIGRTPEEVAPQVAPAIRAQVAQVLATGRPAVDVEAEGQTPARPGSLRTWLTSWYPILDAAGGVMGVGAVVTDITDRKRVEEALWAANASLRDSEGHLRFVLAAGRLGSWRLDLRTNRLHCSDTCLTHFGLRPGAGDLTSYDELRARIHPDDRARVEQAVARAVADGSDYEAEYRVVWPGDGQVRWIVARGRVIRGKDGASESLAGITFDFTDRKRAEEALRASNERYETVSRATNDAVWDWDLATNQIEWGAGLGHLFGYAPEQVARDVQWWAERVHPEDRARVVAGLRGQVVGAAGAVWHDEYRFRRADGSYAHVFDRGSVIRDEQGRALRMIGAMSDVSERRRAEQALRVSRERLDLVLGATDLGLWYCDLPLDRLEWNERCKEHFFLPPDAEVTIHTFFDRIHPDDRDRTRKAIDRSIGSHEPFDTDYRTVAPDGRRVRWVRAIGRAFYDPDGTPRRFDGITIDVTERREAEEELTRAKEAAEAANAAKDQFLAVLSHELRTPLTPVLGTIQAMEDEPGLTPELRESVDMIRRNVELEAKLIDDLLDLTRVSKGKLELHVQTVDAHACLHNALDICRGDLLDKGLRLEADWGATRHHVRADFARLHQVFWNLIKNAVKFTPAGGTITVRTRNEGSGAERAPRLVVEVADTGIGIEPDVLPRIFDAFEQGERSITRRFGGLGLGLAISKALLDMQGGQLSARSEGKGKGAAFAVELATVEPRPVAAPVRPARGGGGGAARPDLRILLVDDHADTAKAMAKLLSRNGYQVAVADSVGSALETFGREGASFDLLISDIGLPDGSGLELMRQIREMRPGDAGNGSKPPPPARPLRGIALSGFGMEEDVRRSREAGFFAHLTKPVNFPQLCDVIQRATTEAE